MSNQEERLPVIAASFILCIIVLGLAWFGIKESLCPVPPAMLKIAPSPSCFEFWFSRYQPTFQTIITVGVAALAWISVQSQIRNDRYIAQKPQREAWERIAQLAQMVSDRAEKLISYSDDNKELSDHSEFERKMQITRLMIDPLVTNINNILEEIRALKASCANDKKHEVDAIAEWVFALARLGSDIKGGIPKFQLGHQSAASIVRNIQEMRAYTQMIKMTTSS